MPSKSQDYPWVPDVAKEYTGIHFRVKFGPDFTVYVSFMCLYLYFLYYLRIQNVSADRSHILEMHVRNI